MSLQFIFTQKSFFPDQADTLSDKEEKLRAEFEEDRYKALFQLGFETPGEKESPSLTYLRLLSEHYLRALTSMPELELLRELAVVTLSDEDAEELLLAVPFGIGRNH